MSLLKSIPVNPADAPKEMPTPLKGVLGVLGVLALVNAGFLIGHLREIPFHDAAALRTHGVTTAVSLAAIVALVIGRGEVGRRIAEVVAVLGLVNVLSVLTQTHGPADDSVLAMVVVFAGMYAFILWALERSEVAIWYAARAMRRGKEPDPPT